MEEAILKLLYDYSIQGKLAVSRKFIESLLDIVVNELNIHGYVKKPKFEHIDSVKPVHGKYNMLDRTLTFDLERIKSFIQGNNFYESSLDTLVLKNSIVAIIVLHELWHAYENKVRLDASIKTTEAILLRAGIDHRIQIAREIGVLPNHMIDDGVACFQSTFAENHDINPVERMAELSSYRTLLRALKPEEGRFPFTYDVMALYLTKESLKGYNGYSPTMEFLNNIGRADIWRNFSFYDINPESLLQNVQGEYSLNERLFYGFPINEEEYKALSDKLK